LIQKPNVKVNSICGRNYWGSSLWISTQQVNYGLIFCIPQIPEKTWEYKEAVHQLFIDFKKVYDSVRREVLYSNLLEFGVPMKLVRLIKMCLTETCSRVRVGKNFVIYFLLGTF